MKHAKKLVYTNNRGFIPDIEYTYKDPQKKDKIETDNKIIKTLKNPKLSQLEKHVKYQALNRKRKRIIKEIEDKPLKVIIDSKQVSPTTGIETKPKIQNVRKITDKVIEEPPKHEEQENKQLTKLDAYKGVLSENKMAELADYIYDKRRQFGILETGQIFQNMYRDNRPTKGSHYRNVLKFLAGIENLPDDQKRVSSIFIKRLLKDEHIKNTIQKQEGQGKPRYVIDLTKHIKNKKTIGLARKFKPTLWTKIPA
jgi:hypothetical protein